MRFKVITSTNTCLVYVQPSLMNDSIAFAGNPHGHPLTPNTDPTHGPILEHLASSLRTT